MKVLETERLKNIFVTTTESFTDSDVRLRYLETAFEIGFDETVEKLGQLVLEAENLKKEEKARACYIIGQHAMEKNNFEKGFQFLHEAAELDNKEAHGKLAYWYYKAENSKASKYEKGTQKRKECITIGSEFMRNGAEMNDGESLYIYAEDTLESAQGDKKFLIFLNVVELYQKAFENGFMSEDLFMKLGHLYEDLYKDVNTAYRWYHIGAFFQYDKCKQQVKKMQKKHGSKLEKEVLEKKITRSF